MRSYLMLAVVALVAILSGCRTAEVVVSHPLSGVHIAAKFEAKDDGFAVALPGSITLVR
jgi:hypothetical protein